MVFSASLAQATFMPENDLWKEDDLYSKDANMTEAEFTALTKKVIDFYAPFAKKFGGNLSVKNDWKSSTVNASANQTGGKWAVNMYGALARRKEVTQDGFLLVVCHEVGHDFGGFPLKGAMWAANEGQADYFATETCAKEIWGKDTAVNATFRNSAPEIVKTACNKVYADPAEQNLCYRTSMAGLSLANLLAALKSKSAPHFETPDLKFVQKTNDNHPAAQCRLDTYFNGALCQNQIDSSKIIPGRSISQGQQSQKAEEIAADYSCFTYAANNGVSSRPRCWFKPRLGL